MRSANSQPLLHLNIKRVTTGMNKVKLPFGILLMKEPIPFHSGFAIGTFLNNR